MAFTKVSGGKFRYLKYADQEEGDVLAEGVYMGSRKGNYGIQHHVQEANGETAVLNSSGHLNYLLEDNKVRQGDVIRVTYGGTEKLEKGKFKGKDAHKFELEIDFDRRARNAGSEEDEGTSEEDDDSDSRGRRGGLRDKSKDRKSDMASGRNGRSEESDAEDEDGSGEDDEEETDEGESEKEEEQPKEEKPAQKKKQLTREELMAKYGKKGK